MKKIGETIASTGLVIGLALGATACGGDKTEGQNIKCVGVDFASPKGGPGEVVMNVFPVFNRNFGDARPMKVTGKVEKGNSSGTDIIDSPGLQAGTFNFEWNTSDPSVQTSLVKATVDFEGKTYNCASTELKFDPQTYKVTPHLANSPY